MNTRTYSIDMIYPRTGTKMHLRNLDDLYIVFHMIPDQFVFTWLESIREDLATDGATYVSKVDVSTLTQGKVIVTVEYSSSLYTFPNYPVIPNYKGTDY